MTEAANMQAGGKRGGGKRGGGKRLIIDLAKCDGCRSCVVSCGWEMGRPHGGLLQGNARDGFRPHGGLPHGNAMLGLREKATFMLLCRRCEHASCVIACPFDAIERQVDGPDAGLIKRYNLRCVSCMCCAHACPFGTIYTDMLPFYDMPYETFCANCLERSDTEPACVASCGQGALEYRVPDPAEADVHILDEHLAARVRKWTKNEIVNEAGSEAGYETAGEAPA